MSHTITDKCNGCQACTKICPVNVISGAKKGMHTIDPSGCLDCGACGRVCPQGAVIDKAGRVCTMVKRSLWKKPLIDRALCMSCNVCADSCPVNCIGLVAVSDARDLHKYPVLQNEKACLGCGICQFDCPVDAIRMETPTVPPPK